tara:strand:+ start:356 stop:778 length:423 start_codon:yes stop_codon:yes gene_type:complete
MRKIEEQMLEAIRDKKNWSSGNAAVTIFSEGELSNLINYKAHVSLHGHTIAIVDYLNDNSVHIDLETLAEWPTRTTTSRLRALSCDVKTKGGITYVWGLGVHRRLRDLVDHAKYFPPLISSITEPAQKPLSIWDEDYWAA